MKKKILSTLLALCLALSLLPSAALAITEYRLYVGNTLVYSSDARTAGITYYWKAAASGDDAYADTGSANDYAFSVLFDDDSEVFTLTLNGVDITTTDGGGHGVYGNTSLNIVLADGSSNSVSSSGNAIAVGDDGEVISISGSGSLTAAAGTGSSGIYSPNGNISIEGGTVTACGNTGISASAGSITISDGTVTAGGRQNGIWSHSGVTISGGSVKVTATNTYGQSIYTGGSVSVTASPYKFRTNTSATAPEAAYTLFPGTAFANSGSYKYVEIIACPDVYVSGNNANSGTVKVSSITDSGNTSYWLNDGSGSITSTGASAESYNVKYNEATRTLTLKNASITSFYSANRLGIYAPGVTLRIVLEGNSVIGTAEAPMYSYGINCGNLSISSDTGGSLSIVGSPSHSCYGIYTNDVSISSATVSFTSVEWGIRAQSGFSLSDGTVSLTSRRTGIDAVGDVAVTGAQTVLNVTSCTATSNGYGIVSSNGMISIADAAVSIVKNGYYGDAARAQDDIRISGGADICIVDWSYYEDDDCGLHADSGSVAIGGSAQVDICSRRIGIYAGNSVYLGYVWDGCAYTVSGSPTVKINDPDSVAAITPETPSDFAVGENGIKVNAYGIYMADGTLTAVGSERALEYDFMSYPFARPSSYKYKSSTEASDPGGSYTYGTYTYSPSDKYLEIAVTYTVSKETAENGSFTVSVDGAQAESAAAGDTVTLAATPSSGYAFSSWNVYRTGDAGTTVSVSGHSFTMPAYAVTAEASFTAAGGSGGNTPSRTITVTETSSGLFDGAQGAVTAAANMTGAFSSSVEVRVTDTDEPALGFGLGAGSTVYPFDISLYIKGTDTKTQPRDGYAVTIRLPVPDALLDAKERLSVVHKSGDGTVATLASQLRQISGVWYLVFEATAFSPYALAVSNTGSYDEPDGVPYYAGPSGDRVFIGFAANGKYIAPSGATVSAAKNDKSFADLSGHWAAGYIGFVTEREIFLGTGTDAFSPDSGMSRAMFATVVGRLYERSFGEIRASGVHAFADCDYGDYYGRYVDWAAEEGIVEGCGNGTFCPDEPITREQMAAILYRFADFLGALPTETDAALHYPDAEAISSWAENGALYCQTAGIVSGRTGGAFAPDETVTRAEAAAIIRRFVEAVTA